MGVIALGMNTLLDGACLWGRYDSFLASYAQKNSDSAGRQYLEKLDPYRLPFQRDRDRILHTTAFRRLKGKMQVVSPDAGDHFRNRLSHTIEVVQIARDLARELRLNEDLVEAVALAHDLGHPPFGHAGEGLLDEKMKAFGRGFNHNEQSLRVVTCFENKYSDFQGLNLSLEVLEGLQKHETSFERPDGSTIFSPHLESQLVDVSDEIAYLSADLEDGLRGGFFCVSDLMELALCREVIESLPFELRGHRSTIIRAVIHRLFRQMVHDTERNIQRFGIHLLEDVQKKQARVVGFSDDFFPAFRALRVFLFDAYYQAPPVLVITKQGEMVLDRLFDFLYRHPEKLSSPFSLEDPLEVRVCDYIAGMTDGYAEWFLGELVVNS